MASPHRLALASSIPWRNSRCERASRCASVSSSRVFSQISQPAMPAPPVNLLEAGHFDLPGECPVTPGRVYRMSYTVSPDGRTGSLGAITPPDAPACLQAALASWVATFRYAPVTRTETVISDWMLVTARRGS